MDIKKNTSIALFLVLNLIFSSLSSAYNTSPIPNPNPQPNPNPRPNPNPQPNPNPRPNPNPQPNPNPNPQPNPNPNPQPNPNPNPQPNPNPNPQPNPSPPGSGTTCPRDALKLGVCADLLGGLLNITLGTPPVTPCCTLIQGLVDLEAAICFCTAIRANILGINLNVPLSLSLLLNVCSRTVPPGFQCA